MTGSFRAAVAMGAMLLGARVMSAQDPAPPPVDTTRADTLPVRRDTSSTERLLQVEGQKRVQLSPMPLVGTNGVRPAMSRVVMTRDSIDWAAARTLGDLLDRVPGVFTWRGGWLGRAEQPNYLAHGAASAEYFLDGMPYLPVGPDSIAVDAGFPALSLLDRVEVERSPTGLRVHMFTRRHDRQAPRTRIGVSSGDRSLARYIASFERRYPSGIGVGAAAEYFGVNAPQGGSGASNVTNGWVQLGWVPSASFGVQLQAAIQAADRDTLFRIDDAGRELLSPAIRGRRTDLQLRAAWRGRTDGTGLSADAFAGRVTWKSDDDAQVIPSDDPDVPDEVIEPAANDIGMFGGIVAWRAPLWSAQLNVLHQTERTSLDARLALGWTPWRNVTASVEGVYRSHAFDRTSSWGTVRAGVRLPLGVDLTGSIASGERVASPALRDDVAQEFTDHQISAGFQRARVGVEAAWMRTSAWRPLAYPQFARVTSIAPVGDIEWAVAKARVAPLSWLTLESRYEHPVRLDQPEGAPPHHALSTATVRSKFLRNFPSGTFDLKVQAVVESWSDGVVGRDAEGAAIVMPGRTFVRGILQLQLGPFIAYYDRVNFRAVRAGNIPGYPVPALASSFGVRWEFLN